MVIVIAETQRPTDNINTNRLLEQDKYHRDSLLRLIVSECDNVMCRVPRIEKVRV